MESQAYRAGFVAIVGRPSSGKSTFLNTACGHKVSIVTPTPQTTRARIRGIVSRDSGQIVFLDTPGFHTSSRKFNRRMMGVVRESLADADAVLLLLDASRESGEEEAAILEEARATGKPLVVAVNKVDLEPAAAEMRRQGVASRLAAAGDSSTGSGKADATGPGDSPGEPGSTGGSEHPGSGQPDSAGPGDSPGQPGSAGGSERPSPGQPGSTGGSEHPGSGQPDSAGPGDSPGQPGSTGPGVRATILTMNATDEESAESVVRAIIPLLPEGEPYYPPEYYTDQDPSFRVTEIVREKAMAFARQELPHALYVGVQDSESGELDPMTGQPRSLFMRLAIYVERESQKGIIVGKGGSRIKQIRESSEAEIAELFDYPVKLELRVKVKPKWRKDDDLLEAMFE